MTQHDLEPGAGLIASTASENGIQLDLRIMASGDRLPNPRDLDGLVLLDGPLPTRDSQPRAYPPGVPELITAVLQDGMPLLGIGTGAHQMAIAAGGKLLPDSRQGNGYGWVDLTPSGAVDPVFSWAPGPAFVFQRPLDLVSVPDAAIALAGSHESVQAFRLGRAAYGLQFHIELDFRTSVAWARLMPDAGVKGLDNLLRVMTTGQRVLSAFMAMLSPGSAESMS